MRIQENTLYAIIKVPVSQKQELFFLSIPWNDGIKVIGFLE
jgi:hypothetical protein